MSSDLPPVITAAILTGGRARRFQGRDKSRLVVPGPESADRSILDRQLDALGPIASRILIVTSAARAHEFSAARVGPDVRVLLDAYPGRGPLGAIVTALDAVPGGSVLAVAGDMPHVSRELLAAIIDRHGRRRTDATVPESSRGLEPLCAVYAPTARAALAAALDSGDLSLQRALGGLNVDVIRADELRAFGDSDILFRNINTPGDLAL